MSALADVIKFKFVGGNLSVDFCNTVAGDRAGIKREYLNEPVDFIGWSQQAGLLTEAQAEQALKRAEEDPMEAQKVLARAIELREAIFRLLNSCRSGEHAADSDLTILNAELTKSMHRLRLVAPAGHDHGSIPCHYEWSWEVESDSLEAPLGPIAHAAAMLLTVPNGLEHVRICLGDNCGWLFIDTSKNHSRCWCDMRDCGNRAKIRRHRMKNRAGA